MYVDRFTDGGSTVGAVISGASEGTKTGNKAAVSALEGGTAAAMSKR